MTRNRKSAKAAGARFERLVADALAHHVDDRIDRRVKTGASAENLAQPWENVGAPEGAGNTTRRLTRSSDLGREGLAMKATRTCNHCGRDLPTGGSGRGGKQSHRRYCSIACKTAHRYADIELAAVECGDCGGVRMVKHPDRCGATCRACSARRATVAAAVVNRCDPLDRFAQFVALTDGGCWQWIGTTQVNGYGAFYLDGRTLRAHRWSYEHFAGPIPEGLHIDHLCRNRACVNPAHLEPVTPQENMRRARGARR